MTVENDISSSARRFSLLMADSESRVQVVDSEIPKGKGVAKPDSTGLPNFFEIFQRVDESKTQSELVAQGKAVGDHWLSHRGRKVLSNSVT